MNRTKLQELCREAGLNGWAESQEHLCGLEKVLAVLGEPTREMCEAGEYDDNGPPEDCHYITDRDAEGVWIRMWSSRLGEGG
jgi:hypothetical protein